MSESSQQEESGKIMVTFVKDKLLPAVTDLEKFTVKVADYNSTLFNSFFRGGLRRLNLDYKNKNREFFTLYHLYSTPDELFKDIIIKNDKIEQGPNEQSKKIMANYMSMRPATMNSFGDGFKLLEIIDRHLNRYSQSADQRVATTLSILAITVSIITLLRSNFDNSDNDKVYFSQMENIHSNKNFIQSINYR